MVLSVSSPPLRVNSDVSSWELLCSSNVMLLNVALLAVTVNTVSECVGLSSCSIECQTLIVSQVRMDDWSFV